MTSGKIKVVFCLNDFLVGGMQRQFAEQMKIIDRHRFEVILVTLFEFQGKETMYADLSPDMQVYRLSFSGLSDMESWRHLYLLLKRISPDIVVSSLFFSNTAARVLRPFLGYVCLAREHNTYLGKPLLQRLLDRILSTLSVRIVAVSKTVADFTAMQERIPREKFLVIHNGINTDSVRQKLDSLPSRESIRARIGYDSSNVLLLNVARLTVQKNHRLLIEAFKKFAPSEPAYKLLIVGDGALMSELRELAADCPAIRFFGYQSDVWSFYKAGDALISTSTIEGLSNAYLEALASGLPLIVTNTAGTDELLEDGKNGVVIEESTIPRVLEALGRYSRLDLRYLRNNAENTARQFDIRETVKKYQDLFQEVAHT